MGLFNKFPYTDLNSINLDYTLNKLNDLYERGEALYTQLQTWQAETTEELASWKADVESGLADWKTATEASIDNKIQLLTAAINAAFSDLETQLEAHIAEIETTAVNAASAASASATAAAGSASDAADSATAAAGSASDAEDTAESLSESLDQIATNASDITDLKSAFATYDLASDFEIGSYYVGNGQLNYTGDGKCIRSRTPIDLKSGDIIGLTDYTNARFQLYKRSNNVWAAYGTWKSANFTITDTAVYQVVITNATPVALTTPNTLAALFFTSNLNVPVADINIISETVKNNNTLVVEWNNGNIENDGRISQNVAKGAIYTNKIPCNYQDEYRISVSFTTIHNLDLFIGFYDENGAFISRLYVSGSNYYHYNMYRQVTEPNAKYIAFSWYSYHNDEVSSCIIQSKNRLDSMQTSIIDNSRIKSDDTYVKTVSHRGWIDAPENTLIAFMESARHGYTYVETDIQITSDGVLVLLHDATINRTAYRYDETTETWVSMANETPVNISDITYEEALEYDFGLYKGAQYAGTKIPTLAQFLALCKKIRLKPYLEIKSTRTYTQAEIDSMVSAVKDCDMENNVSWISGAVGNLTKVQHTSKKGRFGFVTSNVTSSVVAPDSEFMALKTDYNEIFIASSTYANEVTLCKNAGVPLETQLITNMSYIKTLPSYISGVTSERLIASEILYNYAMT